MAGSTLGFASDTDAIHVNPAAIAAFPHFSAMVGGFFDVPQSHYVFSAEGVDSKINAEESIPVSGGLSYQYYLTGEGFQARKGHVVSLAVAVPLYPEVAFVGVTGRWLKMSGAVVSSAITMDAAVMLKPIPLIGISAVGYNLIDVRNEEARRSWGFGLAVGKETSFHVDLDVRLDPNSLNATKATYSAGAEYLIAGIVAPRVGYAEDALRGAHLIAGGVSIVHEGFAIDVSYRHAIHGGERNVGIALRAVDF